MTTFVCVFNTVEDLLACFPNSKTNDAEQFLRFQKKVDSLIERLQKQGVTVASVVVDPVEYASWFEAADDETKQLSEKALMDAFAAFKGNQ